MLHPITTLDLLELAMPLARPDILVVDLDFAGSSSLPLVSTFVRAPVNAAVIVYSALDSFLAVELAKAAGAHTLVSKRAAPATLLDAVDAASSLPRPGPLRCHLINE